MKPVTPEPHVSALAKNVFRVCLGLFSLSVLVFVLFLQLNRHIETTPGKVVDIYTRETVTGRKSVGEREYMTVQYSVNGRDYTDAAPVPSNGGVTSRPGSVPVFYYSGLPYFGWLFERANGSLVYCSLFLAVAAGLFAMSLRELRKEKKAVLASPKRKK